MNHRYNIKIYFCLLILNYFSVNLYSQNEKKIQFVGTARSILNNDDILVKDDTITSKSNMGGYALIDLGVNILPNKNTEILGMIRIKNQLGGFYGAGVTFDVRQLYIKGIISNVVRYQLGDINYKLTPFTFYNNDYDDLIQHPQVFNIQKDIVNYETFYKNNTWRQQGAALDFSLEFSKFLKEIKFNGFINRINITDFNTVPDRFFTGGNIGIQQSKNVFVGFNYVSLFDLSGTSQNNSGFNNNVSSINYEVKFAKDNLVETRLFGETGLSNSGYSNDTSAPKLNDFFINMGISNLLKASHLKFSLSYLNVGPNFRSAGAQSKRLNYNNTPSFYDRYTNQQSLRSIGLFDLIRDEKLYNRSINSDGLMAYNPAYNNAMPYGIATFNRQGINSKINFNDPKKILNLEIESYFLKELIGQGTTKLKSFKIIKSNAELNLKKLISIENNFKITAGFSFQSSIRNSETNYEEINLNSAIVNTGIEYELYKNIDILAGFIYNQAKGNEILPSRNIYSEVVDFNEYNINIKELMLGGGLRYRFSDKIYLAALYQNYDNSNKLNSEFSYSMNQFIIIYNMKF
jgi:hypothetical protein